jgi:hypothetical protein
MIRRIQFVALGSLFLAAVVGCSGADFPSETPASAGSMSAPAVAGAAGQAGASVGGGFAAGGASASPSAGGAGPVSGNPVATGGTTSAGAGAAGLAAAGGVSGLADDPPTGPIPDFGSSVLVFDPTMAMGDIQAKLDASKAKQSEFASSRFAYFFKPGKYSVDVKVGYYTQALGLGATPDDVTVTGAVRSKAELNDGNATTTFWKAVENLAIVPTQDGNTEMWAISQGTSFRRVHVKGPMRLWDDGSLGWSSGGFIADTKIDSQINSGSQQQFFTRNTDLGKWSGGSYNMVFVGDVAAPSENWPSSPYSVTDKTPVLAEKPYLFVDSGGNYFVRVPAMQNAVQGYSWADGKVAAGHSISTGNCYIAKAGTDTAATMNAALAAGKHLLLTPGIYHLSSALQIDKPNIVLMGIGLATLIPDNATPALSIADVDGVRISGLIVQAGAQNSDTLVQVGAAKSALSHAANPSALYDISCRIGGAANGVATSCITVNSNDVLGDNWWLWRADHGADASWNGNKSQHGLIVNGDRLTMYALFAEHFQNYQTMWNGNGGQLYFYQSELPYDPPNQSSWTHDGVNGYASYKVADSVTSHTARGLGVYAVFSNTVNDANAIEAPSNAGVKLSHMVTTCFGGSGGITHVFNGTGAAANPGSGAARSSQ